MKVANELALNMRNSIFTLDVETQSDFKGVWHS